MRGEGEVNAFDDLGGCPQSDRRHRPTLVEACGVDRPGGGCSACGCDAGGARAARRGAAASAGPAYELVAVKRSELRVTVTATGTLQTIRGHALSAGTTFSEADLQGGSPACVLGTTVRRELFGAQDPLGASIRIGGVSCTVMGVIQSKGQSTFGQDQDDFVIMPLTAFQRRHE